MNAVQRQLELIVDLVQGVQLLDLPNELLLQILGQLQPDALLFLSMLCRRLHYLALPILFGQYGMDNPTHSAKFAVLDSQRDPLLALQIALFVPSITQLSCSFPHYDESIRPLFPHIRRLRALIARLAFVNKVALQLDTPGGTGGGATGQDAETWASEFGQLLNTILERGCTVLTLRYGMFFCGAYELRPARLGARPVNALRNAVRHMMPDNPSDMPDGGWDIFQMSADTGPVSMGFETEESSPSRLTHFNIESSMLLHPPCLSWLLSALRYSPISCLEFFGITLPTKVWSAVLPPIASVVPALTELNLSSLYGISGIDILLFLAKLPRLKSLTIGYTEYSRHIQSSCPDLGPVPKLHELTHLHAPSTFTRHFLKRRLPNLQSICVTPRRLILGFRGMRHIGGSLSDIVQRLKKHKLGPVISLEIHCGQDSDAEMAADLALVPGHDAMKALGAITRLIVHSDADMSASELDTLARWITRFPGLRHVSVRVRGRDDAWATLATARTISEQNPNVVSLELNGTLFDARNTLKPSTREIPPFIGV